MPVDGHEHHPEQIFADTLEPDACNDTRSPAKDHESPLRVAGFMFEACRRLSPRGNLSELPGVPPQR